jgi:hypothetical protein
MGDSLIVHKTEPDTVFVHDAETLKHRWFILGVERKIKLVGWNSKFHSNLIRFDASKIILVAQYHLVDSATLAGNWRISLFFSQCASNPLLPKWGWRWDKTPF